MIRSLKSLAAFAMVAALFAGCGSNSSTGGDNPPAPTGSVSGTISLNLSDFSVGTGITGFVAVVIGGDTLRLAVDEALGTARTLTVTYNFPSVDAGRATVAYVADLTVGTVPFFLAGYQFVSVVGDQNTRADSSAFLALGLDPDFTATSGAPQISDVMASAANVVVANVTISGSLANVDLDHIFIFVNGNSFQVAVNPSAAGTCSFSNAVTLDPGVNEIFVVAINSTGAVTISQAITVTYTPQGTGKSMVATLVWNSPTSDMDLHMWYYRSPNPTLPSTANFHVAYWNKDVDSILPNGTDSLGNLDVDDTYGQGPEHITLIDYPDGYYVFAVNSFSLHSDSSSLCTVTLSAGSTQQTMQHLFTVSNSESYTTNMEAWVRCFDARVQNGVATILAPNAAFQYHETALSKLALPKKIKAK
jgi:uncharacterized protein YfaP (DUF2135 family)